MLAMGLGFCRVCNFCDAYEIVGGCRYCGASVAEKVSAAVLSVACNQGVLLAISIIEE
jgi:hypothetical protein